MKRLFWTLAEHDCLTAQLLLVQRDDDGAAVFLARAAELLECRARSRDPQEPWQSVLSKRSPS